MAVLSETHRYLYVLAPRTACTAISNELVRHLSGEWLPERDITSPSGELLAPRKHTSLSQLLNHGLLQNDDRKSLLVFTAVRNPFDSLVSLWKKQATAYQTLLDDPNSFIHRQPGFKQDVEFARDHSFPEWVHHRFAHKVDEGPKHLYGRFIRGADTIMRYETLQADFDRVLADVGASATGHRIPLRNATAGRETDYRAYYDDHSREVVSTLFAKDLTVFGYSF